jgi:hypothetical protein
MAYKFAVVKYNNDLSPAVRSYMSPRNYLAQCPTRFSYNRYLSEVTSRNIYASRDVFKETPGVFEPRQCLDSLSRRRAGKFCYPRRKCAPAKAVYDRRPNPKPCRGIPEYI